MGEPEGADARLGDTGATKGRTFLVTGANTGIGRATAEGLARQGGRVWIAARSPGKGEEAVASVTAATGNDAVFFLPLDLADLDSVRACAEAFLARGEPLHVLVNNAGVGGARGLTRQGFEMTFGINHLGHFALTAALLGCLGASAPARVVTVSSDSHYAARGIDFEALRRPARGLTGLREYAVSKLCNVLFSQELARRTAGTGITTYALHPGVVASDIWRRVPWPVRPLITRRMLSVDEGAATSLYCATSPEVAQDSGLFYDKCAPRAPSKVATPELAAELWKHSEEWAALLPGRRRRYGSVTTGRMAGAASQDLPDVACDGWGPGSDVVHLADHQAGGEAPGQADAGVPQRDGGVEGHWAGGWRGGSRPPPSGCAAAGPRCRQPGRPRGRHRSWRGSSSPSRPPGSRSCGPPMTTWAPLPRGGGPAAGRGRVRRPRTGTPGGSSRPWKGLLSTCWPARALRRLLRCSWAWIFL